MKGSEVILLPLSLFTPLHPTLPSRIFFFPSFRYYPVFILAFLPSFLRCSSFEMRLKHDWFFLYRAFPPTSADSHIYSWIRKEEWERGTKLIIIYIDQLFSLINNYFMMFPFRFFNGEVANCKFCRRMAIHFISR